MTVIVNATVGPLNWPSNMAEKDRTRHCDMLCAATAVNSCTHGESVALSGRMCCHKSAKLSQFKGSGAAQTRKLMHNVWLSLLGSS